MVEGLRAQRVGYPAAVLLVLAAIGVLKLFAGLADSSVALLLLLSVFLSAWIWESTLLAALAHDLKTPVATARGAIENWAAEAGSSETSRLALEHDLSGHRLGLERERNERVARSSSDRMKKRISAR